MGIKLIVLLALLVGVLYSLHLLVKDYQALTAPRLLRFLFKRDVSSQYNLNLSVRWKSILRYDPVQCARYLYCDLGARPANNAVRRGFAFMLTATRPPEKHVVNKPTWYIMKHRNTVNEYASGQISKHVVYRLEPEKEHRAAWEVFRQAYQFGMSLQQSQVEDCRREYPMCPFHSRLLFDLVDYMVHDDVK